MNVNQLNGAELAYLGDAVIELMMRRRALEHGIGGLGALNEYVMSRIRATAQSDAVDRIVDCLTEDELAVFKRGRNASGISAPKSASVAQYRRATGFEALFGMLYLTQNEKRLAELFALAYPDDGNEKTE